VESQRPERVPFDLAAKLHLKFDTVAVACRDAMGSSAWPAPTRSATSPGRIRRELLTSPLTGASMLGF
jgi:hypothetical protein